MKMYNIFRFLSPSHAVRVTAPSSEGAKGAVHPYTRKQQFTLQIIMTNLTEI